MAFTVATFGPIGGQSRKGKTSMWWTYTTTDAIATVNSAGYFTGDSVNMLAVRNVIIVVDTNTPTTSLVSVLSNDGTTVDVSDGLAITETDSD